MSLLRCRPIRTEINASFELHIRIKLKPVDKRGNGKDLTNNNYWGKKANKNRHLYFRLVFFGIDSAHLCIEYKLKQTVFMHDITGSFSHHIIGIQIKSVFVRLIHVTVSFQVLMFIWCQTLVRSSLIKRYTFLCFMWWCSVHQSNLSDAGAVKLEREKRNPKKGMHLNETNQ